MSTPIFKAQATRLALHLADKHGIKLKHASVLEAIAALHGARDWNTLSASSGAGAELSLAGVSAQPQPGERLQMTPVCAGSLNDTMASLLEGVRLCQPKCAVCKQPFKDEGDVRTRESDAGQKEQLCRSCFLGEIADQVSTRPPATVRPPHTLVMGAQDMGAAVLLEQMAVQHVSEGGGLLYVSTHQDLLLHEALRHAASEAKHKPQFLSLAPPDPAGVETCVPRVEALAQAGFIMHVVPASGERAAASHAGVCLLLRQLDAVLAGRTAGARKRSVHPLMVVLPAANFDLSWLTLLRQGRSLGVTFVLQADSPSDLDRIGLAFLKAVTENVGTQLLLMPAGERALARTVSHVVGSAVVSPERERQVHKLLKHMGPGEALRLRQGVLEAIRYDGLSVEAAIQGSRT